MLILWSIWHDIPWVSMANFMFFASVGYKTEAAILQSHRIVSCCRPVHAKRPKTVDSWYRCYLSVVCYHAGWIKNVETFRRTHLSMDRRRSLGQYVRCWSVCWPTRRRRRWWAVSLAESDRKWPDKSGSLSETDDFRQQLDQSLASTADLQTTIHSPLFKLVQCVLCF